MLKVDNIYVNYGAIQALQNVSFEINTGEIVALIGANGAGKTTILNTISNIVPSVSGKITYEGKDITKTAPHDIVKVGISQVPEGRRVFAKMSVLENLEMGAYTRSDKAEIAVPSWVPILFQLIPGDQRWSGNQVSSPITSRTLRVIFATASASVARQSSTQSTPSARRPSPRP